MVGMVIGCSSKYFMVFSDLVYLYRRNKRHVCFWSSSLKQTGPIETKLGTNVHWIVLWNVDGFFIGSIQKKERKKEKRRGLLMSKILILSESCAPIGNDHCMVLQDICVFCWSEIYKRNKRPKDFKNVLSVFNFHLWNHWTTTASVV